MEDKIKSFEEVCEICHGLQKKGKKIVFVHGFFDILHRGHITLFAEAKKHGDILVVGVDCDANAKLFKSNNRPINSFDSRMFVLSAIEPIDYIFQISAFKSKKSANEEILDIYITLRPNVLASNKATDKFWFDKKNRASEIEAEFADIKDINEHSTTSIAQALGLE